MARTIPASLLIATLAALAGQPAMAFDGRCAGAAVECYEKVRRPDVYALRPRPVLVRAGYREVIDYPPAIMTRPTRVALTGASWRATATPAVYGTYYQNVLVRPARMVVERIPATTRIVRETVIVRPAAVRWERRRDGFGRETRCRVETPAVTRTVARRVVEPAQRVARQIPPLYKQIARPVLLRPAAVRHVYEPPVYDVVDRPFLVKPAERQIVDHPAVVGIDYERVFVRHGGYGWRRMRPALF